MGERYTDSSKIYAIHDNKDSFYSFDLPSGSTFVRVTQESYLDSFISERKGIHPIFDASNSF